MKKPDRERVNQRARAKYQRRGRHLSPSKLMPGNTRVDYGHGLTRDFSPDSVEALTALLGIPATPDELCEATREWAESTMPDETGSVLPRGQGAAQAAHATVGQSGLPERLSPALQGESMAPPRKSRTTHKHHPHHDCPDCLLYQIILTLGELMGEATRAKAAADAIAAEVGEVKQAVADLLAFNETVKAAMQATIDALQAQVDAGAPNAAALTSIADELETAKGGFDEAEATASGVTGLPAPTPPVA